MSCDFLAASAGQAAHTHKHILQAKTAIIRLNSWVFVIVEMREQNLDC
jgi:hypothetical protein